MRPFHAIATDGTVRYLSLQWNISVPCATLVRMPSRRFRDMRTVGQFGVEVRRLRESAEMSQAQLAEQAGVSRRWLGRLERGHVGAELDNVMRLTRALDLVLRFDEAPSHE